MAKDTDLQEWSEELVRRIGAAIKSIRGTKSAKWLSDRTAELGYRISPTVIAKLDSGHRGNVLSVAELLILAAALEVPPLLLLFPDLPETDVEVIPHIKMQSERATQWFAGEAGVSIPFSGFTTNGGAHPYNGGRAVEFVRTVHERRELMAWLATYQAQLHQRQSQDPDNPLIQDIREQIERLEAHVKQLTERIHQLGVFADKKARPK